MIEARMKSSPSKGLLSRLARFEAGEITTAILMLSYSFCAMASYNVIKPVTRSKFIDDLGSVNIPFVQLAAGFLIGFIMIGYGWLIGRLPKRWGLPITQFGIVGILLLFWFLFHVGGNWVSVAFYLLGAMVGILLISQFWILANLIYDPRQAKRLFGFVGAGAPLGGFVGYTITARYAKSLGSTNLLPISAALMAACAVIVIAIIRREDVRGLAPVKEEKGVRGKQAIQLLRESRHLKIIALVISFASIGAAVIEQQVNMAAEAAAGGEGAIASFLGKLGAWTSGIGFIVQILLTSRIHRFLGIGFALMILPVSLGTTGFVILLNTALWAPGLARVLDQSLRYTVDKTTREILFMPLPGDIKMQAKPFVDVTVDRVAKGVSALLLLVLIQPWGLHLTWQKLSYASLALTVLWVFAALKARGGYLEAFRHSIEVHDVKPAEIRLAVADPRTVEILVEELCSTDSRRVLYAVEILDSLEKKHLVSPLLLYHDSPEVRARAVAVLDGAPPRVALRWLPGLRRLLKDPDPEVRMSAVGALANLESVEVSEIVRPLLRESNSRVAMTAAMILSRSTRPEDVERAEEVLRNLAGDPRDSARETRKELAAALRHVREPRFRRLLVPLLMDSSTDVAREALRSVRHMEDSDSIFVPSLISLLRHPKLKGLARDLLADGGEEVLDALGRFLDEPEEDLAVRLGLPGTIARIPSPRSVEILTDALEKTDGALRERIVAGLDTLRRRNPEFAFRRGPVDALIQQECRSSLRYSGYFSACCGNDRTEARLLARAVREKAERSSEQVFRLLGLVYPWKDIAAARIAIGCGGPDKARALEYLDNLMPAAQRRQVIPVLEKLPCSDAPANREECDEALRELILDPDPVISAAAADWVWAVRSESHRRELEQLVSARDTRDWQAVEAAAWVLRALELPAERVHELSVEPFPAVEIAARLSTLPVFAAVPVQDLFRIARSGRQVRHAPGATIYPDAALPDEVQFLLAGKAARTTRSGGGEIDAPAPLAFEAALQGRALDGPVRAVSACVCLALTLSEFRDLMAGSTSLIEGFLRLACTTGTIDIGTPVIKGEHTAAVRAAALAPVDKAILLESLPPFSGMGREETLAVAAAAMERHFEPGARVAGEMDPPALHVVVSGMLRLEAAEDQAAVDAAPGDAVGLYQTITGIPLVREIHAGEDSVTLSLDREDCLDLLTQRPELLSRMLAHLFQG